MTWALYRSHMGLRMFLLFEGSYVSSRIEFIIATLTFKVLKFQQPAYMFDLIAPYIPPQSLRSSNKNLLIVPDIRSEMDQRSFFLCCTYHLELSPFTYSFLGFTICFYGLAQDFLISKVSSTIVINSLHIVSSDFDLRTYNGHSSIPCISHFANNLIAWKGCPRCLYLKSK